MKVRSSRQSYPRLRGDLQGVGTITSIWYTVSVSAKPSQAKTIVENNRLRKFASSARQMPLLLMKQAGIDRQGVIGAM